MIDKLKLVNEKRKYGLKEEISDKELIMLSEDVPIQKIIGYIEMANVKIDLSKNVLIPRYETEELIYIAFELIVNNNIKSVLDLATGSGFIGIALKKKFDYLDVHQSDIDLEAINQTNINLKINDVKTNVIQSNMFEKINQKFDLIISNPPYLIETEKYSMSNSVLKHEPHHALFASDDGLFFYKIIEKNLFNYLNDKGFVLLEINPLNVQFFKNNNYQIIKDINNKERFAIKQINYSTNV